MTESTILTSPQLDAKPAKRNLKFILGAVIIFAAIGFLEQRWRLLYDRD